MSTRPQPDAGRAAVVAVGGYDAAQRQLRHRPPNSCCPTNGRRSASRSSRPHPLRIGDLGLKVGHATRNVDSASASRAPMTIAPRSWRRAFWGDRDLAAAGRPFRRRGGAQPRKFVQAKLAERDERHAKAGSRYLVEPNVRTARAACATTRYSGSASFYRVRTGESWSTRASSPAANIWSSARRGLPLGGALPHALPHRPGRATHFDISRHRP